MSGPPLPGAILMEQYLRPRSVTQQALARAMGVSPVVVHHIVHGKRPITVETALRLGKATATKPEYWLQLQAERDLFRSQQRLATILEELPQLAPPAPAAVPGQPAAE